MQVVRTARELRELVANSGPVAFVPTMGCLHAGHASLVDIAGDSGLPVVVSVFVNRLQFAPGEDFDRYPRTLEADLEQLRSKGCHAVFAPSEQELYPRPQTFRMTPPAALADTLEGACRPGFFTGVCTVVMKLLCLVRPATVVFGKKDYQQWRIIEDMVRQMDLGVRVQGGEVVREADGLALSSRNRYLSEAQRRIAPELAQAMSVVRSALQQGEQDHRALERAALAQLKAKGWEPDYIAVRDRHTLASSVDTAAAGELVVLGAARIGNTRLIDALEA